MIRKIFTIDELLASRVTQEKGSVKSQSKKIPVEDEPKLFIGDQPNVPYQFVKCCDAKFSDELVGFVTRGRGVSVHRTACPVIRNTEPSRLVKVCVAGKISRYEVNIKVEADDREGLVKDITHIIADNEVNIVNISQLPCDNGYFELAFVLDIESIDQLERVLSKLEKIPSVRRACKVN